MGLDVGTPNEMIELNGVTHPARDAFGIKLDTAHYVKRACRICYGRGVLTVVKPVTRGAAEKLIKDGHEQLLHQSSSGKYVTRSATMCTCARYRYHKLQEQFVDRLIAAGLAVVNGSSKATVLSISHRAVELL